MIKKYISVPYNLECVITRRLIKKNNLLTDIKMRKRNDPKLFV